MKLTFRQIEAFQAVIATGSVTEASVMLGVSQPAVSRLLADLEAQVGFALFQRAGRNLNPTTEARLLIDTVRRAFGGLDRIREAAEAIRDFRQTPLMLVTSPSFAVRLLPDLVAAFARRRPDATISLDVQTTDDAIEWLALDAYDFGFCSSPSANPRLTRRPILLGQAYCVVPAGHRLASRTLIGPADLNGESLIAYRADAAFRHELDRLFEAAGAKPVIRYEARTTEVMMRLVERGLGVAIVGTAPAQDHEMPGCHIVPFSPFLPYTLYMLRSAQREMSAVAADFAAMIDEMFGPETPA